MKKTLHFFAPEIRKYKWWLVGMIMSISLVSITQSGYPFLLRKIANIFSNDPSRESEVLLHQVFLSIFGLYVCTFFLWRIFEWTIIHFESLSMRDIDQRSFAIIQKKSFRFFQEEHIGSLVKKAGRLVNAFETFFDQLSFILFRNILDILIILTIFSIQKPIIGLLFGVWSILFIGGNYFFSRWKLKYDEAVAKADSQVGGVFTDSWGNFGAVKSFAKEEEEFERVKHATSYWEKKNRKSWILNNFSFAIQSFLMISMEIIIILVLINGWKKGTTNVGDFIFFETFLIPLFRTLWDFGKNLRQLFRAIADAKEMGEILEQEEEVKDISNAPEIVVKKGDIAFHDVQFSYSGDRQEIQNISLTIPAGQSVALVGNTGSGKTTITKLLLRFFDISSGTVTIDGQNIAHVTQQSLRRSISLVPQMPELFFRSISENIAFGKTGASKEEIRKAAEKAGAIDFINALPNGFDTLVGERGVKLSGGERQRIAIARAFLKDAPILVLDEATSALDSITEKAVQGAIEALLKNRTSIVIAHRLSTILQVDRILVLEKGKIAEDGTHEELLKNKGCYAEMWEHQSGGFLQEDDVSL